MDTGIVLEVQQETTEGLKTRTDMIKFTDCWSFYQENESEENRSGNETCVRGQLEQPKDMGQ